MKEMISSGYWPANMISDIRTARRKLRENGYEDMDFICVSHYRIIDCFEHQVFASSRSCGEWLLDQGIIYNIITDNDIEENTAYIYATKSGIPLIKTIEGIHVIPNDSIIKITNIMDAW